MALSGTFKNNFRTGYGIEIDWSATQNISANTSTITAKLYWCSYGSSYTVSSSASKTAYIAISNSGWNSTTSAGLSSLSGNQRKLIHTYSYTVTHSADGTCNTSVAGQFNCEVTLGGTYYSSVSVSGNFTLNTIPRASTISSNVDWTAGTQNLYVSMNVASSSFTHDIRLQVQRPDGSWATVATRTGIGSYTTMTFTADENKAMYQAIGGYENRPSWVGVTTKSGGTVIGSEQGKYGTVYGVTPATITFDDFYIGNNISARMWNMNSGFTYTGVLTFGNFTKSLTFDPSNSYPTISFTQQEIQSLYAQIPNSNSGSGNVYISSQYSGVEVNDGYPVNQNKSFTAYVTNSNPTFGADYTYKDSNTATVNVTGNNQYIIQNKSKLLIEIPISAKATAINGASMSRYDVSVNGVTKTANFSDTSTVSFDFGAINASSNITMTVRAYDSRGNSTATSKSINIVPYSLPIATATTTRLNGFENSTTISLSGSVSSLNINSVNKNSIVSITYQYRESGGTYSSLTNFAYSGFPSYTATSVSLDLDNLKSWDVLIVVTDKLGSTNIVKTVSVGQPIMFMDSKKKSIGINQFPVNDNSFEVTGSIINNKVNTMLVDISNYYANTTYFKIADLPATTSGTHDLLVIELHGGGWNADQSYTYNIELSARDRVNWMITSIEEKLAYDCKERANIVVYDNAVYLKCTSYVKGYLKATFVGVPNGIITLDLSSGVTTVPSGTLNFDSQTVPKHSSLTIGSGMFLNDMYRSIKNTTTNGSLYAGGHIEMRTTDGSAPAIGFHRAGNSGLALFHDGVNVRYPLKTITDNGYSRTALSVEASGAVEDFSGGDLNTLKDTGFYRGYNVANTPNTSTWYYIEVIRHDSSYVVQRLTDFFTETIWFRRLQGGTWQGWQRIPTGCAIQRGSKDIWYSATTRMKGDVTFPWSFNNTPSVSAVIRWQSSPVSLDKIDICYVENVSNTGFTVQATNKYGTSFDSSNGIWVDWIAIAYY